jgi:hypothetical protein
MTPIPGPPTPPLATMSRASTMCAGSESERTNESQTEHGSTIEGFPATRKRTLPALACCTRDSPHAKSISARNDRRTCPMGSYPRELNRLWLAGEDAFLNNPIRDACEELRREPTHGLCGSFVVDHFLEPATLPGATPSAVGNGAISPRELTNGRGREGLVRSGAYALLTTGDRG